MTMSATGAVEWSDEIDEILGGDLTAALACATPAGGCVVMAVTPLGMRDRAAGTVTFTTSLGVGRKLDRIRVEPRVALAYHARDHGTSTSSRFVLVQGIAQVQMVAEQSLIDEIVDRGERLLGGTPRHPRWFWERWLREYVTVRVPVVVTVTRVTSWSTLDGAGQPEISGAAAPAAPPSRKPPAKGTAPRTRTRRTAARVRRLAHQLVGFLDADGAPTVLPVRVLGHGEHGLLLDAPSPSFPGGARRAGMLAHSYRPRLVGLRTRYLTGWMTVDDGAVRYAPHTDKGYAAPPSKTLVLLVNGLVTKIGVRRAVRRGELTEFPRPLIRSGGNGGGGRTPQAR